MSQERGPLGRESNRRSARFRPLARTFSSGCERQCLSSGPSRSLHARQCRFPCWPWPVLPGSVCRDYQSPHPRKPHFLTSSSFSLCVPLSSFTIAYLTAFLSVGLFRRCNCREAKAAHCRRGDSGGHAQEVAATDRSSHGVAPLQGGRGSIRSCRVLLRGSEEIGAILRTAPTTTAKLASNELIGSGHRDNGNRVRTPGIFLRGEVLLRGEHLLPGDSVTGVGRFPGH
jgi:hypothetical protein